MCVVLRGGRALIDEIISYEKNARHNEKAIPVVADSIRGFRLRGQIVLKSHDTPVIVTGHTGRSRREQRNERQRKSVQEPIPGVDDGWQH